MKAHQPLLQVAVLLPTRNGARYVESQLTSLTNNRTPFILHWLDDHSTDTTREIVRSVCYRLGISLRECHSPLRQGIPGVFFQLIECVEADIYLFCDQDDIWQPGKIDATVQSLLSDIDVPAISFTDPLAFRDERPDRKYRMLQLEGARARVALQESRLFMPLLPYGHTVGFTRPLREIFMRHNDIARAYAFGHDVWMYAIAVASGTAHFLKDAPTTLYRWHGSNWTDGHAGWRRGRHRISIAWRQHQHLRLSMSRHAQGFILASPTLPPGPKLERLLSVARLVAALHRRHSLVALLRLARNRAMWPSPRYAVGLAATCLCSDASRSE
jgi:glycosyltransferase involved in cell wall biosynthesis